MFGIDPRLAEADGLVEGGDRALPHLAAVDAQGEVRPRAIELPRRPFGPRRVGEDDVLQLLRVVRVGHRDHQAELRDLHVYWLPLEDREIAAASLVRQVEDQAVGRRWWHASDRTPQLGAPRLQGDDHLRRIEGDEGALARLRREAVAVRRPPEAVQVGPGHLPPQLAEVRRGEGLDPLVRGRGIDEP